MPVTSAIRTALSVATARGLPAAIWRRPGADAVEGVISASGLTRVEVFDTRDRPAFLFSPFLTDDAAMASAIAGDAVLGEGGVTAGAPEPSAEALALLDAIAAGRPGPVHADAGGTPPATLDEAAYCRLVASTVAAIAAEPGLSKIVTSRAEARPLAGDARDVLTLFERLDARYPQACVTLILLPGEGAWLVATPETLLRCDGRTLSTMALAGTQAIGTDTSLPDIAWTDKFIEEQAIVQRDIRRAFQAAGFGADEYGETGPRTVRAASLAHLRTTFELRLAEGRDGRAAVLLREMHPTAAVCGLPKDKALAFLTGNEGYDRGLYAGYFGPAGVSTGNGVAGDVHLFVNLRSARVIGDTAWLHMGGGIVADSDPEAEWQETVAKTRTIGAVLD